MKEKLEEILSQWEQTMSKLQDQYYEECCEDPHYWDKKGQHVASTLGAYNRMYSQIKKVIDSNA